MKTAVLISGLCRCKSAAIDQGKRSIDRAFPGAEFFFSTWEGQSAPGYGDVTFDPEPEVTYDVILDVEPSTNEKFIRYQDKTFRRFNQKALDKQQHAFKQILAHAYAIKRLSSKYDLIIRSRWGSYLSHEVDITPWIERALTRGPVGMTIGMTDPVVPIRDLHNTMHWNQYLPDTLILHTPNHFDPQLAEDLYQRHRLRSAEWGWWQVMSEPYGGDIHTSLGGGVVPLDRRNVKDGT